MWSRALFSAVLLAIACLSAATDKEVDELLARMRQVYRSARTATFVTKAKRWTGAGEMTYKSEVTYGSPRNMHIRVTGGPVADGDELILVSNGRQIECRYPGGKTRMGYDPDSLLGPAAINLESICFWDGERQLSTRRGGNMHESKLSLIHSEEWKGKSWIVLEESAPQMGVFVRYFIAPDTYLIWRTVVQTLDRKRTRGDYWLEKIEIDSPVKASLFKLD